jgi:hypothetical protein
MLQQNVTRDVETCYAKRQFQNRIAATGKNAHPTAAVGWAFLPDRFETASRTNPPGNALLCQRIPYPAALRESIKAACSDVSYIPSGPGVGGWSWRFDRRPWADGVVGLLRGKGHR